MEIEKHGYPRRLILKDGREVRLRPMDPGRDRELLLTFFARMSQEDRWYLHNDVSDESVVQQYLLDYHPRRMVPILAQELQHSRIAAKASLYLYPQPGARSHIGRIRLMVDRAYAGQRLGTYLLLDMVNLGMDLDLRLLTLEFIRGVQDKAIRAARRLDFYEQAVMPDYAKDPRGNHYDLVIMTKRIHTCYSDY